MHKFNLREEQNGYFYATWTDANGARRKESLRTKDKKRAEEKIAVFTPKGKAAKIIATGGELLRYYQRNHIETETVNPRKYNAAFSYLYSYFEKIPLRQIDLLSTRMYRSQRRDGIIGSPAMDSTIRWELTLVNSAVGFCEKHRLIKPDHRPRVELPPISERDYRWLEKEELAQLIAAAGELEDKRLHDFIVLAYSTGARRAAIETLTVSQVDWKRRLIELNPKGRRRTKKRRPTVPIYPMAEPVVQRLICERAIDGATYLLGSKSPVANQMKRLTERIGLKDVSPHTLRHSRATHLLQDGHDIFAVAKLLGDNIKTVEDTYGHHHPDYLRILE